MMSDRKVSKHNRSIYILIGVAIGFCATGMLYLGLAKSSWPMLGGWAIGTITSALIMKRFGGFPAFSVYSLTYSLPVTLLSLTLIPSILKPPPADPVGGTAMAIGMSIVALIIYAPVLGLITVASFRLEKRGKWWYIVAAALYSPLLGLIAARVINVAGS